MTANGTGLAEVHVFTAAEQTLGGEEVTLMSELPAMLIRNSYNDKECVRNSLWLIQTVVHTSTVVNQLQE